MSNIERLSKGVKLVSIEFNTAVKYVTRQGFVNDFPITFDYQYKDYLRVLVGFQQRDDYTILKVDGIDCVRFNKNLVEGVSVTIRRVTPSGAVPHIYQYTSNAQGGAEFSAKTIDENFEYMSEIVAEVEDYNTIAQDNLNGMEEKFEETQDIANEAIQLANEAKDTADNAEQVALGIDGKAQEALDNSVEALGVANDAKTTALGIDGKAQEALDNSAEALGSANTALTVAQGIDGKAQNALDTAQSALNSIPTDYVKDSDFSDLSTIVGNKRDLNDNVFNGLMTIKSDNDEQETGISLQEPDGTVKGQIVATDQGLQLTQYPKDGGLQTFTFPEYGDGGVLLTDVNTKGGISINLLNVHGETFTDKLEKALTDGGVYHIPAGEYDVDQSVIINQTKDVQIYGVDNAHILFKPHGVFRIYTPEGIKLSFSGISFSKPHIPAGSEMEDRSGIIIEGDAILEVSSNIFTNSYNTFLLIKEVDRLVLKDNKIHDNVSWGFTLSNFNNAYIYRNECWRNGYDGIKVSATRKGGNLYIYNNTGGLNTRDLIDAAVYNIDNIYIYNNVDTESSLRCVDVKIFDSEIPAKIRNVCIFHNIAYSPDGAGSDHSAYNVQANYGTIEQLNINNNIVDRLNRDVTDFPGNSGVRVSRTVGNIKEVTIQHNNINLVRHGVRINIEGCHTNINSNTFEKVGTALECGEVSNSTVIFRNNYTSLGYFPTELSQVVGHVWWGELENSKLCIIDNRYGFNSGVTNRYPYPESYMEFVILRNNVRHDIHELDNSLRVDVGDCANIQGLDITFRGRGFSGTSNAWADSDNIPPILDSSPVGVLNPVCAGQLVQHGSDLYMSNGTAKTSWIKLGG